MPKEFVWRRKELCEEVFLPWYSLSGSKKPMQQSITAPQGFVSVPPEACESQCEQSLLITCWCGAWSRHKPFRILTRALFMDFCFVFYKFKLFPIKLVLTKKRGINGLNLPWNNIQLPKKHSVAKFPFTLDHFNCWIYFYLFKGLYHRILSILM